MDKISGLIKGAGGIGNIDRRITKFIGWQNILLGASATTYIGHT